MQHLLLIKTLLFTYFILSNDELAKIHETVSPDKVVKKCGHYYILDFDNTIKSDTLYIECDNSECMIIWQKDTIYKDWSNSPPINFISSLGALGIKNTFLIKCYEGDACPTMYKLIHFKNNYSYYLSPPFGNCDELSQIKIKENEIDFEFSKNKMMKRVWQYYKYYIGENKIVKIKSL